MEFAKMERPQEGNRNNSQTSQSAVKAEFKGNQMNVESTGKDKYNQTSTEMNEFDETENLVTDNGPPKTALPLTTATSDKWNNTVTITAPTVSLKSASNLTNFQMEANGNVSSESSKIQTYSSELPFPDKRDLLIPEITTINPRSKVLSKGTYDVKSYSPQPFDNFHFWAINIALIIGLLSFFCPFVLRFSCKKPGTRR